MQKSFYQTADAGDNLSDSGCRRHSIRQRMQETLYQPADTGVSLSDSGGRSLLSDIGCRPLSIRQRMQESLYQTADAEVSLSDSGCRRHSIRQRLHLIECLLQPLSDGENPSSAVLKRDFCIRCLIEILLHPLSDRLLHLLSDRVSPASAV